MGITQSCILSKYLVIPLPDQFLTAEQQRGLADVFGAPAINPYARGRGEYPVMKNFLRTWRTLLVFLLVVGTQI